MHNCPRCGFQSKFKHVILNHLNRKKVCNALLADISKDDAVKTLNKKQLNEVTYKCSYCERLFNDNSNRYKHEKICKSNDNDNNVKRLENEIVEMKEIINKLQTNNLTLLIEDFNKLKQDLLFYKNKKNEAFYQAILEKFLMGTHKKLQSGITDITTDTCHAEIKEWCCYKEGIGQLMAYNVCDPKELLEMYMFGNYSNGCKDAAANIISACKIQLYEFVHNDDRVDIVKYEDKSIVYSYVPTF